MPFIEEPSPSKRRLLRMKLSAALHRLRGCGPFTPVWDGSGLINVWACSRCGALHRRSLALGRHHV